MRCSPAFRCWPRRAAPRWRTSTATIGRLIQEAKDLPRVAQRIDFISAKLLGTRYQANTMIGTPKSPEEFVVRDDAFDCVTFCEVALAAALARDLGEFETALRRIRYDHGAVQYEKRNHYFADWCRRNIDNGICQPVAIEPTVTVDKTVTWHREFGKHKVSISGVTKTTLFGNAKKLAPGDIVGFTSRPRESRLLSHRPDCVRQERRTAAASCIAKSWPRHRGKDGGVRECQSGANRNTASRGRNYAGRGAPLKRRIAGPSRCKRATRPLQATVAELIRSTAAQLKRARLVFAHGTDDPVAEAAFMVGETLGIHPDHIEARAGMAVSAAQQRKIAALTGRRIRTRKPAAYLLKRIYMRGVPFYIDERAIVPRSYLGEILERVLAAARSERGHARARSLHRFRMSRGAWRR